MPVGSCRTIARVAAVLATAMVSLAPMAIAPVAGASTAVTVPVPLLTVPPDGLRGHALWDSYYDLAPFGYEEQELFVSGTAVDSVGNGAPYTTRIIVTRPVDPARFNGTVLLDWVNVTAQFENAVDTMLSREMLMREGFAYVHVSAQGEGLCCLPLLTPKLWDPVRYASIDHPGDAWAFDMFGQVAQAFRQPQPSGGTDPMGALGIGSVRHVLAAGQSQSGILLHDYIESWLPAHPEAVGVIDGFLVHGDVGKPKSFGPPLPVPVLQLLSDFEAVDDGIDPGSLDPNQRLWEIAGTSHADLFIGYQSIAGSGPRSQSDAAPVSRDGFQAIIDRAGNYGALVDPLLLGCVAAGAAMPMHYAASAAIHALNSWVGGAAPPAEGPRFAFAGGALARDSYGNAVGGIRLPPIDVPVASYVSTICGLGGITIPFTDQQIQSLYPTHADYLATMASRADAAVTAGFLLPDDAVDLIRRACAANVRWPAGQAPCAPYVPPAFGVPVAAPREDAPAVAAPAASASSERGASTLPATGGQLDVVAPALLLAAAFASRRLRRRTDDSAQ
ncbi:MAG: alpha/beta hydrolase domain-containing protein [Acidimicrobiales bacterium]